MKYKFLNHCEKYDGRQLKSLHNYLDHGLLGDSIIAWIGPCDVSPDHMIDGEDLLQNAKIAGDEMLHFIIEKFDVSLFAAVGLQRIFADLVRAQLIVDSQGLDLGTRLVREGDDIYFLSKGGGSAERKKLSISIATQTPVSSLIHFAVNVVNEGTPVPTCALEDFKVSATTFADKVAQAFINEVAGIKDATQKVRWAK